MAAVATNRSVAVEGPVGASLYKQVRDCKVLVVGAGGIGCELLKNLATTGFQDITLIDLDTIDVTNLNRQFFFQKEHVGKSKAHVSAEAIKRYNPHMEVRAIHGSIIDPKYNVKFFQEFKVCLNALDNVAARRHVNRLCLAAQVPLVESGTKGYIGQVEFIKKGVTECYECRPKEAPKQYPTCTLRNTPSLPIHCIVWGKHVFNQLFGIPDDENDVTPDTDDTEAAEGAGDADADGGKGRVSHHTRGPRKRETLRDFAKQHTYDAAKLFTKLFHADVATLLSMDKLWEKRRKPTPLDIANLPATATDADPNKLPEQRLWSLEECKDHFLASTAALHARLAASAGADLVWDKDDEDAMEFVVAASNLREYVFGIERKTYFDTKSMAGNIIPAIATTNAIIAGVIVLQTFKILAGKFDECKNVGLSHVAMSRGRIVSPGTTTPRNPECFVCKDRRVATVDLDINRVTVGYLHDHILKKILGVAAPDVSLGHRELMSSEEKDEEEQEVWETKVHPSTLAQMGIADGAVLEVEDFLQNFNFQLTIVHAEDIEEDAGFRLGGDAIAIVPKEKPEEVPASRAPAPDPSAKDGQSSAGAVEIDDEDELSIIDDPSAAAKRPLEDEDDGGGQSAKRARNA